MKAKAYIVYRVMREPELEWSKPKDCLSADPLYTTPPQRTWVELTDEKILEIASPMFEDTRYPSTALDFARAILRKAQKK